MKRYQTTAALVAGLFGIMLVATGCGSSNSTPTPGGPGAPGMPGYNGMVNGIPAGGTVINFTGNNVYNSGIYISGGQANGYANCSQYYCYCGLFSANDPGGSQSLYTGSYGGMGGFPACWQFTNAQHSYGGYGTGTVIPGGPGAANGNYIGNSAAEPGVTVRMMSMPSQGSQLNVNVTGSITLTAAFMQRNAFSPNMVTSMAVDFYIQNPNGMSGGSVTGGILFYTDSTGSHGVFLKI